MNIIEDWVGIGIPEDIIAQACTWIVKLDDPDCSTETEGAFLSWLERDLLHQWAYEELAELWAKAGSIDSVREGIAVGIRHSSETVEAGLRWWESVTVIAIMTAGVLLGIINAST